MIKYIQSSETRMTGPGRLLVNQARYFHTGTFAAAKANFEVIDFLGGLIHSPPENIDGQERWQINSGKCYHYWTTSGTDCGRCITACPFSHPDNGFHHFIRWSIKNNLLFRHLAIKLDDLFYGRKPEIRSLPEWSDILEKP